MFAATTVPVQDSLNPASIVSTNAAYGYLLPAQENSSIRAANRLAVQGIPVYRTTQHTTVNGAKYAAGSFIVETKRETVAAIQDILQQARAAALPLAQKPAVAMHVLTRTKIGLYKSWVANMDEGWTRWMLEQYAFAIDTLHDADIRSGNLQQYKAIIIPDQAPKSILSGYSKGDMPDQYTGGIGLEGMLALQKYTEAGGTVLAFDRASNLLIEQLGLPVKDVVDDLTSEKFYVPGSLLRIETDTTHPLTYGMQFHASASFHKSRAFTVIKPSRAGEGGIENTQRVPDPPVKIIASYAKTDLLMSGWALNADKYIAGKAAMLEVQQGKGRVILFGFRPQFRAQSHGTYKLIFNALL